MNKSALSIAITGVLIAGVGLNQKAKIFPNLLIRFCSPSSEDIKGISLSPCINIGDTTINPILFENNPSERQFAPEEEQRALEEGERALEEGERVLEEEQRVLEEEQRALEEGERALEEGERALEEEQRALEEEQRALEEERRQLRRGEDPFVGRQLPVEEAAILPGPLSGCWKSFDSIFSSNPRVEPVMLNIKHTDDLIRASFSTRQGNYEPNYLLFKTNISGKYNPNKTIRNIDISISISPGTFENYSGKISLRNGKSFRMQYFSSGAWKDLGIFEKSSHDACKVS